MQDVKGEKRSLERKGINKINEKVQDRKGSIQYNTSVKQGELTGKLES